MVCKAYKLTYFKGRPRRSGAAQYQFIAKFKRTGASIPSAPTVDGEYNLADLR